MPSSSTVIHLILLLALASSALAGALNAKPAPKVSKPKPYPYKQTNRAEILKRQKRKALGIKRAVPSNVPGPDDVSPEIDDSVVYRYFYGGSGHTETNDNPSNDSVNTPPVTNYFSGDQTSREAAQTCADFTYDLGYYAFQVYYRKSTDEWTCVSYIYTEQKDRSDASYFNVEDPDVVLAYGYQYTY